MGEIAGLGKSIGTIAITGAFVKGIRYAIPKKRIQKLKLKTRMTPRKIKARTLRWGKL